MITVRRAKEEDRKTLSHIIATGFEKEFSALTKDMTKVARALCSGIQVDRFFVAELDSQILGAAACTDRTGRAVYPKLPDLRKHLGFIKGILSYFVLRDEFTGELYDGPETGYIEFVAVSPAARGKGIAKQLLQGIVDQSGYADFVLDVTDVNTYAIRAYTTFGFRETHRVAAKRPEQEGYNAKVYMRYVPEEAESSTRLHSKSDHRPIK